MQFGVVDLPPGVARNGTQYQTKGRWYDVNLVRWFDGIMRPIGGWNQLTSSAYTGKCRAALSWTDNDDERWVALGTSSKLYISQGSAAVFDVTPVGFTAGTDDATEAFGYGGGLYGVDLYGTARAGGSYFPPNVWMLDTWGEYLVGCARSDGKLYEWTLTTGTPAAAITNAPINCVGLIVSDERHLIALGAGGNVRRVEWSDAEDNTTWTPAADNEAGGFELQTTGSILGATRVRGQILILTDSDAHAMRYVGSPFVFSRERVGAGCGVVSPGALISVESRAFWMGQTSFWQFDGATVLPLPCEVSDFIFSDLDDIQNYKIVSGHNPLFGEVWWFYPTSGSTEPDRYVIYNYREGHWSIGELARTAWDSGEVFGYPFACGTDNHLYRHEDGFEAAGSARYQDVYAKSGVLELDSGERTMHVMQVIPDEQTQGEVELRFQARFTPTGTEYSYGPYSIRADGYTDTRLSGRQITMEIAPTVDDDFRIGKFRLQMRQGGGR